MSRKFMESEIILLANVKTTDHVGDLETLKWIVNEYGWMVSCRIGLSGGHL
jgi:hypothetical protein